MSLIRTIERRSAAGAGTAVLFGEADGGTPFTEGREVTLVVQTLNNWAGTGVQVEGSDDGTTWTGLLSSTEQGYLPASGFDRYEKTITLPRQLRVNLTTRTGGGVWAFVYGIN